MEINIEQRMVVAVMVLVMQASQLKKVGDPGRKSKVGQNITKKELAIWANYC